MKTSLPPSTLRENNRSYGFLLFLFFSFFLSAGAFAQTVTSDKDDYAPGEVAIITGAGWTNDQYVDVHFEEEPVFHTEHQHDYHGIAVDENGNWTIKYQIEDRHLGVAFDVHVIGKQSGAEAHTYFTDAAVEFKASGLPDPTKVTVTSISYTIKDGKNDVKYEDSDKPFDAPNGKATTSKSAVEGQKVYFTYPHSITTGDGLIYTIVNRDNDVTAYNNKSNEPVLVTYDKQNKTWSLVAAKEVITVTAAYKLSMSPTSLSVGSATGTYGGTTTLTATLKSGTSNVSGKTVDFSLNGGSAISATTDANGVATLSNVSLGTITAGTYATGVTASFAGDASYSTSSGSNSLTVNKAEQVISWSNPSAITYGTALSATQLNASRTTGDGSLTYSPAAGTVLDAGTHTLSVTAAATDNYNAKTATVSLTVNKADATIAVEGYEGTYDGNAHGATGTAKGVKGETLAGLDLGASFTNVPGGTANWVFTDATGNYNNAKGSAAITIGKADATIAVEGYEGKYDGAAHGATGTAKGVDGKALAGLDLGASFTNVPGGTANWKFTDVTGNYNNASGSVAITISRAALTVVADNQSRQYSDPNPSLTGNLSGVVNGDNITAQYTTTATLTSAPRSYAIVAGLNDPNNKLSNYLVTSTNGTLTVIEEDAEATYNGTLFANTATTDNSSKAKVTLKAYLVDAADGSRGDIRNAKVTFKIYDASTSTFVAEFPGVAVNAINGNTVEGEASYLWEPSLGSSLSKTYDVEVLVNGYYTGGDETQITVSKPTSEFVTGGGFVIPKNTGPTGATAGRKNNWGAHVKYNNKMTNLQGNFNSVIRRDGKVYHMKSNSPSSLTVNSTTKPYSAVMYFKSVVVQEIVNGVVVSDFGNNTAVVGVTDHSEPGQGTTPDEVSITILDRNGAVWYSNTVDRTKQPLGGGNIQVRTAATSTTSKSIALTEPTLQLHQNFPNPFLQNTQVNFEVKESGRTTLKVFNVLGQEVATLFDDQAEGGKLYETTFEPTKLPRGVYFYTLTNGKEKVTKRMVLEKN
jgi:hypothetical protein